MMRLNKLLMSMMIKLLILIVLLFLYDNTREGERERSMQFVVSNDRRSGRCCDFRRKIKKVS